MSRGQLDYGVVEKLRSVGGDALVRRMLRLFLVTSGEAFRRIDTALETGNLELVATAAHQLFSSAAQLRLEEIAGLAERLEQGARAGRLQELHAELEQLGAALGRAAGALHAELEKLPKPARIAVVDDSEDVRVLLRLILERQYDVTEYPTGASALLGLRRFPADLLIIDLSLPDMSGIDLLKFIRADTRFADVPALAVTALAATEEHSLLEAGFDLHVRKPILDTDELIMAIDQLLQDEPNEWP